MLCSIFPTKYWIRNKRIIRINDILLIVISFVICFDSYRISIDIKRGVDVTVSYRIKYLFFFIMYPFKFDVSESRRFQINIASIKRDRSIKFLILQSGKNEKEYCVRPNLLIHHK